MRLRYKNGSAFAIRVHRVITNGIEGYFGFEGRELNQADISQNKSWNFQVTRVYGARRLRLFKDKERTDPVFPDGRLVKVGIIDTGIDDTNPDLEGRVVGGINYSGEDIYNTKDYDGHGTWVAGLICGRNEHRGIVPNAELYSIKVAEKSNRGIVRHLEWGIRWAIVNSMDIIVVSSTVDGEHNNLQELCREATRKGIAVIASAGNYICSARWPAGWPNGYSISVGSVKLRDNSKDVEDLSAEDTEHHVLSNKWPCLDYVAPGYQVVSAWLGDKYYEGAGTSIAAPHVAGILAMGVSIARQVNVDITIPQVEAVLRRTVYQYHDIGSHLLAEYWRSYIDPAGMIFHDSAKMHKAMFGEGLVQAKEFIMELCHLINRGSKGEKLFIVEAII